MHPDPAFAWTDREAMLDFVDREGFATVSVPMPAVLHVPLVVDADRVRFHVARRNRAIQAIDGARLIASVIGRHAYHSGSWYASADMVPTWHYEAVEVEGVAKRQSEEELREQLDAMAGRMEPRYAPDDPWTRERVSPAKTDALVKALVGFDLSIEEVRGTRKFNQNKSEADLAASIAGQRAAGREDIVRALEEFAR